MSSSDFIDSFYYQIKRITPNCTVLRRFALILRFRGLTVSLEVIQLHLKVRDSEWKGLWWTLWIIRCSHLPLPWTRVRFLFLDKSGSMMFTVP